MAKKAATKPAKRKPRAKKPVQPAIELFEKGIVKSVAWRSWVSSGLKAVALIAVGAVAGVWGAGGIDISPWPNPIVYTDSLAESHKNDRATQVRILREYAAKTFASEPEAQEWLNKQRVAARPTDWIPYTDELGKKADEGPEAVKAFADALEGK